MRTIKFRGKRVNGGEWVESMTISHGTIKRKAYEVFFEISPNKWVGVISETVGQFTGLLDKNGKEIYEGDIVEWCFWDSRECEHFLRGCIKWHQGGFIFSLIENDFEDAGYYAVSNLDTDTESDVEVLGNIFDNPELLKGGDNDHT